MQVSYQEIKAYLLNNTTTRTNKQIEKLKQDDLFYQLLFEIIDKLKNKVSISYQDYEADNITFSMMEEMIIDILSGNVDSQKAGTILKGIYHSEGNYNRLIVKVKNLAPSLSVEPVPELANVNIKSNEELLAQILDIPCENEHLERKPNTFSFIWNKIKTIPLFEHKYYPRYAFAVILLFIIAIGFHFGTSYYNTTYQVNLASNLLKENYRIYITDTPRLSGGYKSTGISTILSADKDSESYLDQASEYSNKAIANDDKSYRAKLIQAQICIINNDYLKADSILNRIEQKTAALLNDQGVLKYLKDDLTGAERYFKLSIQRDSSFKEAYYNLAITKYKSSDNRAAILYLKEYLNLEDNEGWRNAALNLIEQFK